MKSHQDNALKGNLLKHSLGDNALKDNLIKKGLKDIAYKAAFI